eukprot:4359813-Prymnesium_polylepis.1
MQIRLAQIRAGLGFGVQSFHLERGRRLAQESGSLTRAANVDDTAFGDDGLNGVSAQEVELDRLGEEERLLCARLGHRVNQEEGWAVDLALGEECESAHRAVDL